MRAAFLVSALLAPALFLAAPARAVTIQEVKTTQGITAWLVEDHSVPVVSMDLAFRGGASLDPNDKAGRANFTADLLDEGAGDLDSTAYQSKVEDLSASLTFDVSQDMFAAHLRTLSANTDPTFDLLRLSFTAPRFDEAPVARIRTHILDGLASSEHQPNAVAARLWWKNGFPDHPYGRSVRGTKESVASITTDDLRGMMRDRFAKDVMVVGVVGDITPDKLKSLLDKTFGALPDHAAPGATAEAGERAAGEVKVVTMPIPQSVVIFGENGIKRNDPDWYTALTVMNILSSGGLTSRVALEVREQRGLAYSVSASLNPLQHAGVIVGQVGSQNARIAQAIDVIRDVWKRMHDEGPTAKELADSKTYLTGSFPLSLDSTGQIASTLVSIQFDHLGIDYLNRRAALIDKVTLADAKRVARRLLDPASLSFVVVGSPENLQGAQRVIPGG
jgi:zinc protease